MIDIITELSIISSVFAATSPVLSILMAVLIYGKRWLQYIRTATIENIAAPFNIFYFISMFSVAIAMQAMAATVVGTAVVGSAQYINSIIDRII